MKTLSIDLETYSETDLPSCGAARYVEDPAFEILLFAYSADYGPVTVVDMANGEDIPADILSALHDPSVEKTAYNAPFERTCLGKFYGYMEPEQWDDTMVLASECGLPLGLKAVGEALNLGEEKAKMKEGADLIRFFCIPRKPTKANPAKRNLPWGYPDKWEVFKAYNKRDVEVENTIRQMLLKWRQDKSEHDLWALDQRINDKGMGVDLVLAQNAVTIGEEYRERLLARAQEISGLDNPNSTEQIKAWLREQEGVTVTSLNKKVVADVVASLSDEKCKEFMDLRSEFSKSSVKKYDAVIRSATKDSHIHGCFQFAGAGRTGRWAGRLVQLQNLARNSMEDLDSARKLVRLGDADGLELIYPNVQGVLSELVRTVLVPEKGQKFLVADFAAIEARVIAWIAGEDWRMKVFAEGGDIYCMSASQMFKVPVVKHGVNGELRQKGKIAELACIAEGQLVLTDQGLVPIEKVTTDMRVWDGESWVEHDGVVSKGIKEVITYDGLTATEDHLVWVEGKSRPICFGDAAKSGARILQTGDGRKEIRLGGDNLASEAVERKDESLLGADEMFRLRQGAMDRTWESAERKKPWLPGLFSAKESPYVVVQKNVCGEAAMRESVEHHVPRVRWPWYPVLLSKCKRSLPVHDVSRANRQIVGTGQDRHERKLRAGKSSLGNALGELCKSAQKCLEQMGSAVLAVHKNSCSEETVAWGNERADHRGCPTDSTKPRQKLADNRRAVAVYDIRNAGEHHRFTVSGKLVHNCGYGGGVGALKAFGADKMGLSDEEMSQIVDKWREASPHICALWRSLEQAAVRCIRRQRSTLSTVGGIRFDYEDGVLFMVLPSGRRIAYWGASFGENRWGNPSLSYWGTDQKTKKWSKLETWGGKLVENLVQATARDCLKEAMLRLDSAGYDIRGHVHDEVIITAPLSAKVEDAAEIMGAKIPWAPGLLLRADGYECDYYRKD